jgi:hypothetical protein
VREEGAHGDPGGPVDDVGAEDPERVSVRAPDQRIQLGGCETHRRSVYTPTFVVSSTVRARVVNHWTFVAAAYAVTAAVLVVYWRWIEGRFRALETSGNPASGP